jgi:membrane protein implicated in regulation of membrane protease activity
MDPSWWSDHMWAVWTGLAMLLGVAELFSLDLVLGMLAVGAAVGVLAALIGLPWEVQVLAAVAASVAMLALVRPSVIKRLHAGPDLKSDHDKLIGRQGVVVEQVTADTGLIKLAGEMWTARSYDETTVIEPGAKVDVFGIRGATALVHQVPELDI